MSDYYIEEEQLVKTKVTPLDAAEAFAAFDSVQQAQFFFELARVISTWDAPACFQWEYMLNVIKTHGYPTRAAAENLGQYLVRAVMDPIDE